MEYDGYCKEQALRHDLPMAGYTGVPRIVAISLLNVFKSSVLPLSSFEASNLDLQNEKATAHVWFTSQTDADASASKINTVYIYMFENIPSTTSPVKMENALVAGIARSID